MIIRSLRSRLLATGVTCVALAGAITGLGAPAHAQTTQPNAQSSGQAPPTTSNDQPNTVKEVVVTGSILRRKLSSTENPVTTLTSQDLEVRGITTMADAVQGLAANGAATLPNSFSANGAFAAGASAASLRGLTTNSTLTLIDGMRSAYYPLADDGQRSFVDMNSIPDVIVDRVETLKDGASSTYGADAIAGVINIITKKTYQGVTVKAEGGFTERGGGNTDNFQALVGHGDLARDGYNVYVGVEVEHDDDLWNRQRGYPYDTANLSSSCGASLGGGKTCRFNNVVNGLQWDGSFLNVGATGVPIVLPVDSSGNALGNYQLLNPSAGCGKLAPVTITPAAAGGANPGIQGAPVNLCQQDLIHDYRQILPDDKRVSVSFRATKALGGDAEAYLAGTFYQNDVISPGFVGPSSFQQQAGPGPTGVPPYSSFGLTLPAYICSKQVYLSGAACTASNGTANPNLQFVPGGAQGELFYLFNDIPFSFEQLSKTYRLSGGVHGSFDLLGSWRYNVDATASEVDLTQTERGQIYIANLLQAVATGSYNFLNPSQNTADERNFIAPTVVQNSTSKLAMVQGTLSRDLIELPGGPMQLGLIAAFRYESINNPSANPDNLGCNPAVNPAGLTTLQCNQENRWFGVNAFGAMGSRTTEAVAFEIDAPFTSFFDVDISGRYDSYSSGQSAFSPKIGAKLKPFKWITFRSTASRGFRIPSFGEAYSLPNTGFITATAPASLQAAHNNNGYGVNYGLGLTTIPNPSLQPEISDNLTAGVVLEPDRHFSLSVDYYFIKKKAVISGFPAPAAIQAAIDYYYGVPGAKLPTGFSVAPGPIDPAYPNAQPELGFVLYPFENQNEQYTGGYDIGATARFDLPFGIKYTSVFDGNYTLYLTMLSQGVKERFAGTIGPYNDVSASGTPKFRANWQNSFAYGPATFSATAYYTDGYSLQATDLGDSPGVCISNGASASPYNPTYADFTTPVRCKVKAFMDVDARASYQATPHVQLYLDVVNLFDKLPPLDPMTYGGYQYNPAWANAGIMGRTFKVGVKATF